MSTLLSLLITSLISIITSLFSKTLVEKVLRKVLIHSLTKIVDSTLNTVDNDMVEPIIKALKDSDKEEVISNG